MHILVMKLDRDLRPIGFLVKTKKVAKEVVAVWSDEKAVSWKLEGWRLHDGSGWCDGSDDAWKVIEGLPPSVMMDAFYGEGN